MRYLLYGLIFAHSQAHGDLKIIAQLRKLCNLDQLTHPLGEETEVTRRESEIGERIIPVAIESRRDQQPGGVESGRERSDDIVDRSESVVPRRSGRERDVRSEAQTIAGPNRIRPGRRSSLSPAGRVLASEFVPNADRVTPPGPAAFSYVMLVTTPQGDAYTEMDFARMARAAGFSGVSVTPMLPTPQTLVEFLR